MGIFDKWKKTKTIEIQAVDEEDVKERIKTVDLNKVVSIYINANDKFCSSRFFMGRKNRGVNYEITIGIKEPDLIKEKDSVKLTFNLINSDRYIQHGIVERKEKHLITISLDEDIEKIEDRRESVKMCCELNGSILVLGKDIYVEYANISVGGIFIKTEYELPINHTIRLYVKKIDLNARATVLRKQLNSYGVIEGYGCKFIELDPSQEETIMQYVNYCLSKERETLVSRDVYNYIYDDFKQTKF